jgi:hypothetical protein
MKSKTYKRAYQTMRRKEEGYINEAICGNSNDGILSGGELAAGDLNRNLSRLLQESLKGVYV